jgi:hypothetical protein
MAPAPPPRRVLPFVFTFALCAFAGPAIAQTPAAPGGWVAACDRESAEGMRASAAIRAFATRLEATPPGADPAPLAAAWRELLRDPCLDLAREQGVPSVTTALAMRAWWDASGEAWLHSIVGAGREVLVPAEMPTELSLESAPADHALRPLLCPAADAACGRETEGWRIRAEQSFLHHARDHRDEPFFEGQRRECLAHARRGDADDRYLAWLRCAITTLPERVTFPIGGLRAPDHGWLVMRGRRGHYQWCEEVRAYDLATGAAYVAEQCGALFRITGGATRPVPPDTAPRATVGRLPVENLREAAWMIFTSGSLERRRAETQRLEVPEGIERRFREGLLGVHGYGGGTGYAHSGQTRIAWAWVDGASTLMQGDLTWPDSGEAPEDHADNLLRIAEAALEPGCAPAALPAGLAIGTQRARVSGVDADPDARQRIEDALVARLRALDRGRCPRVRRR